MTDDEVMQWLSDEERGAGPAWTTEYDDDEVRRMQRALAETRRAIWAHRLYDSCWCTFCGEEVDWSLPEEIDGGAQIPKHRQGCIMISVPTPRVAT